jgi:hypothetical protein
MCYAYSSWVRAWLLVSFRRLLQHLLALFVKSFCIVLRSHFQKDSTILDLRALLHWWMHRLHFIGMNDHQFFSNCQPFPIPKTITSNPQENRRMFHSWLAWDLESTTSVGEKIWGILFYFQLHNLNPVHFVPKVKLCSIVFLWWRRLDCRNPGTSEIFTTRIRPFFTFHTKYCVPALSLFTALNELPAPLSDMFQVP